MALTGERKREYQRLWVAARREQWINDNGPCARCGSTENLEVDHIVPREITGAMASAAIWSRSSAVRAVELEKCQVLCAVCHDEKTIEDNGGLRHGTSRYDKGCRCGSCRKAHSEKMKDYHKRRKTRQQDMLP